MEINIISTFFDSNIYLFLFVIPILSQFGIPLWAMFFILFAWSITNSLLDLSILFFIVLSWLVIWDFLSYVFAKKLFNFNFFQYILSKKKINNIYIKTESKFKQNWDISIFLSRFLITGIWPMLNYVAWFQSYNLKKFILFIFLWEILYAWEFLLLWYYFKNTIDDVFNIISNFWIIILLLFILFLIWNNLFNNKKIMFN